jgi:hypothetical protein
VNSRSGREVPDVGYLADPNTGVAVYDSTPDSGQAGWFVVGGTSAGAPQWAALVAIANAGRSTPLSGAGSALYQLTGDFRDITSGTNGSCGALCTAAPGFDAVTGLGSPLANLLVPALGGGGGTGGGTGGTLSFQPGPQTVAAGIASQPMTVQASTAPSSSVSVSLSTSSSGGGFSTSSSGPWTSTLAVTIAAGATSSSSFYYRDTNAGTPTLTATASGYTSATQTETITAAAPKAVTVTSVGYAVSSRNLNVTVTLRDANGGAVAGAAVSVAISRNGASYGSATGTTGSNGSATFVVRRAPSGCYSTTVTKIVAAGTSWDGVTPPNQFCK